MPGHISEKIVPEDDPNRCQGSYPGGQCRFGAVENDIYCEGCGGKNSLILVEKTQYQLSNTKYRTRLAQLNSQGSDIKSLREEIALIKLMVEQRFNMIKTDTDFIAACGPINQMLLTAERLVKTANQIENDLGLVLGKEVLFKLAEQWIDLIIREITPHVAEDVFGGVVDRVSEGIIGLVEKAGKDDIVDVEFESKEPSPAKTPEVEGSPTLQVTDDV